MNYTHSTLHYTHLDIEFYAMLSTLGGCPSLLDGMFLVCSLEFRGIYCLACLLFIDRNNVHFSIHQLVHSDLILI